MTFRYMPNDCLSELRGGGGQCSLGKRVDKWNMKGWVPVQEVKQVKMQITQAKK